MQDNTFYNRQNHRFNPENNRANSLQRQNDSLAGMVRPESLTRQNEILGAQQYNYDDECLGYGYGLPENNMLPLNGAQDTNMDNFYKVPGDSGANTKANIKQYIFSTIDNVLGGGQSSTAQIAQNMSAISNNLSNVSGISHQYSQFQNTHASGVNAPSFFESIPEAARPEKPKLSLKCDMFGMNVLEEDDQKNSLSPALNKQQKIFHDANSQSVMGANVGNDDVKAARMSKLFDQSLFSNAGINAHLQSNQNPHGCQTSSHPQAQLGQANSALLFQNAVNYEAEEFQIRKIKSHNDAQTTIPRDFNNLHPATPKYSANNARDMDCQSKEQSTKKRSRKAYTKKTKKLEDEAQLREAEINSNSEKKSSPGKNYAEFAGASGIDRTTNSVRFGCEVEELGQMNDDSLEAHNDYTLANDLNVARLTNKKKQYLQDAIFDKNGAYSYLEDPIEYKKARKRLQNRESAVRSRQRKKSYQEELESLIDDQNRRIQQLVESEKKHRRHNAELINQNQVLKQQVSYFQDNLANSSLVGTFQSSQSDSMQAPSPFINQDQLDQLKAEILSKLNSRFQSKDMSLIQKQNQQEHLIERENFPQIELDKMSGIRDFEDQLMDDFSELPVEKNSVKRQRLYSGCIQKSNSQTSEGTNESIDSLVLKRENSTTMHSKRYLCLAVLFGVMCASSITNNTGAETQFKEPLSRQPTSVFSSARLPKSAHLDSPGIEQRMNNLNLISSLSDEELSDELIQKMYISKLEKEKKLTLQNSAHLMKTLGQLNTPNMHNLFSSTVYSAFIKTIMSGKYSYLTHLMCSTACFYFWITPNAYKIRFLRPFGQSRQMSM